MRRVLEEEEIKERGREGRESVDEEFAVSAGL